MKEEILDNGLIENEFSYQDNLTRLDRWKSMFLDHAIFCFIILPIFMLPLAMTLNNENEWLGKGLMLLLFGIYFNKDVFKGRSVAKRLLGQVVIDVNSREPANEVKCAIRNFTIAFWIIELIVVLISPNRRIGDVIAGTKVVRTEKEDIKGMFQDFQNSSKGNLILSLGLAIIYLLVLFQFIARHSMI